MPVYLLGVSALYHDSAACLLRDGEIVAAAEEERFSRRKGDERFPRQAIACCLQQAGIDASALDAVAYYDKPVLTWSRLLQSYLEYPLRSFTSFRRAIPIWIHEKLKMPAVIRRELPGFGGDICSWEGLDPVAGGRWLGARGQGRTSENGPLCFLRS
jgi:carbamoyltransferase